MKAKTRTKPLAVIAPDRLERCIRLVRGHRVLLDFQLAELYEVETKVLNQAVKRNAARFPEDFMFRLTEVEAAEDLKSQSVTSSRRSAHGGRRHLPYAFTEQGVAMLSSVLRSERAIRVNIAIMRAFVELRRLLATHADLACRLDELERRYDSQFKVVFDAIRQLMDYPVAGEDREIGFHTGMRRAPRDSASRRMPRRVNETEHLP